MPVRLAIFAALGAVAARSGAAPPEIPSPGGRVAPYAPGVRIDWKTRRVEVDARVVLREGPLELFACSPQTREHESIVVTTARPIRIFEALGLIGLSPGHPIRQEQGGGRWLPATGDPLRINVRWEDGGRLRTDDVGRWMRDPKSNAAVRTMNWVFAGSYRDPAGAFAADAEGTVVCLVDFTSALVALPELHSSDNEALWVEAYTERIPPVGTTVTLVFTPVDPPRIEVIVEATGRLNVNGEPATPASLIKRIADLQGRHERLVIEVSPRSQTPKSVVDDLLTELHKAAGPSTTIVRAGENAAGRPVDHQPANEDSGRP